MQYWIVLFLVALDFTNTLKCVFLFNTKKTNARCDTMNITIFFSYSSHNSFLYCFYNGLCAQLFFFFFFFFFVLYLCFTLICICRYNQYLLKRKYTTVPFLASCEQVKYVQYTHWIRIFHPSKGKNWTKSGKRCCRERMKMNAEFPKNSILF